jgi:hypothetical protein
MIYRMNTMEMVNFNASPAESIFNWKMIRSKVKTTEDLANFIHTSKTEIANLILQTTKKRNLTLTLLRKCSSQSSLKNVIYNADEVRGEVDLVICYILSRWDKYARATMRKKKLIYGKEKKALRLDSPNDIIGYYVRSLEHSFADLFTRYNAQKRFAAEVTFSSVYPKAADEDDQRHFEDDIISSSSQDLVFNSYKRDMINFLRAYDAASATRLAKMFVVMINPRHHGAIVQIQKRLRINNKNFNESKALIGELLRKEFGDISGEVIAYYESKRWAFEDLELGNKKERTYENRKNQQRIEQKSSRPVRLNVIYGQRPDREDKKKWRYTINIVVDRSKTFNATSSLPEHWVRLDEYCETKEVIGKANEFEKMKMRLEKLAKKELYNAEKFVENNNKNTHNTDGDDVDDAVSLADIAA